MTVNDLINELSKYDPNLPVCINDYMGFVEANEETIKVQPAVYICFPYGKNDRFTYINLTSNAIE